MLVFSLNSFHDYISFSINFFLKSSVGFSNEVKNLRNETSKTCIISFLFNICNQNERHNYLSTVESLSDDRILFSLLANLLIFEFQSRIHDVLVRVTNVNNQEVNKNNENDHLIEEPRKVYRIYRNNRYDNVSSIAQEYIIMTRYFTFVLLDPKAVSWISDVANTVFKCLQEESWDHVNVWELIW